MRNIFLLIIVPVFLLANTRLLAQCSVNITTNPNTTQLNCVNTTITLTANATGAGSETYLWSTGASTSSISVSGAGNYSVKITDGTGCTSSSSIGITKDTTAPIVTALAFPDAICRGDASTLIGLGAATYLWQPGSLTGDVVSVSPVSTTTYSVTGTASNGCTKTSTIQIVVHPLPIGSIGGNTTVCQNSAQPSITFTGSSGTKPFTFTYNVNGGPTQAISTVGTNIVAIGAPTGTLGTLNYNLISLSDSNGCTQTQSGTATITVLPGPLLVSPKATSICDNDLFSYTATSSAAGTSFSWTRPAVAGISEPAASGTTATINEPLHNTTSQPVIVKYIFALSTGTGCVTIDSVQVTVNPSPIADPISDKSYCNGDFVNGGIVFTSSSPGAFFTWTNSDASIGLPASGSGNVPAFIATNNSGSSITATITIFVNASADSCVGRSTTFTITVLPAPLLTGPKVTSICDNDLFSYVATSSAAGTSFSWTRPFVAGISSPASSGTATINEPLHNTTTQPVLVKYIFALSTGTGCVTTDSVQVTVNPTPAADPISNKSYCNGDFVSGGILFTSNSPGAFFTWTNSNTNIGLPASGSGSILPFNAKDTTASAITATITVSVNASADSCVGTSTTFTITVLPAPVLTSAKTASICNNSLFSYTAASSADSTTFSWTRADVAGINNPASGGTTATINETLDNTTSQPVLVKYIFALSTATSCVTMDSIEVTVNPTPKIDMSNIHAYLFCNDSLVQPIIFSSLTNNALLTWTSNPSIGFGTGGSGNIPAFIPNNQGDSALIANVKVFVSVGNNCQGDSAAFTITVYPTPALTSAKDTSVCDSVAFIYNATSAAKGTSFSWTRPVVTGIKYPAGTGTTAAINDTLNNTTSQPVVVKYIFTLFTGTGCYAYDTLRVTVNPTPIINSIPNYTFCNGNAVSGISFSSTSPAASFKWASSTAVGFGSSGSDNIPAFIATNMGTDPVVAIVTVSITTSAAQCPGPDSTFTITVNPAAPKPNFTSLFSYPDSVTLNLCSGSENINFDVNSPVPGISYAWTSNAQPSMVSIRDTNNANTVISFNEAGNYTIDAVAKNSIGSCADTVSQIVKVDNLTTGIDKRKIFLTQPGNLLIYPDNSLTAYQWGYDTIIHTAPDSSFGLPMLVQGQVYQFFIPGAQFIDGSNLLDETKYLYWVLLQNGPCNTRVYYNGPYANRPVQVTPSDDSTIQLQVIPDPNNGMFEIALKGNIYGRMDAKIYNSMGQVVFRENFVKTIPEINEIFNTGNLPGGLYFLVLVSSDLKKVVSRFVIQH